MEKKNLDSLWMWGNGPNCNSDLFKYEGHGNISWCTCECRTQVRDLLRALCLKFDFFLFLPICYQTAISDGGLLLHTNCHLSWQLPVEKNRKKYLSNVDGIEGNINPCYVKWELFCKKKYCGNRLYYCKFQFLVFYSRLLRLVISYTVLIISSSFPINTKHSTTHLLFLEG